MTVTVAVLGTGIMGRPMAANLAKAGLAVRAWNRTTAKAEPLREHGVEVGESVTDVVRDADFVVTMLADGEAVRAAYDEAKGAVPEHAVWLQMSTVGLQWTAELAALAGAVPFVDAPVLGTKQPAEQGKLIVLAAGAEDLREKCASVFDAVGVRTIWVGTEPGAASRLKLVANSWVIALTNATAEAVALAEALDVDADHFFDAISGGPLDAGYAHVKGKAMRAGEYPASFTASNALKDLRLVLEAAGDRADLGGAAAAMAHLKAVVDAGHGDEDMAALYRAVAKG
ncbi:NAD(P)-dependent oxidoreductase [Amycolatopsis minnesotensis]|uniref:NAD(P)-dependent oxidoreductase n=1 Tax=Amycolatopsis minnesotensis TaxID=337894 RepID=A0ABP5E9A5_9PSEU